MQKLPKQNITQDFVGNSIVVDVPEMGDNKSHRTFRELNDLIVFMTDFQQKFNIHPSDKFGTAKGIMFQFLNFDLPVKHRNRDEVVITFLEDDPKSPTKDKIDINCLWFDKKTRKVLSKSPDWFKESKKPMINKWN